MFFTKGTILIHISSFCHDPDSCKEMQQRLFVFKVEFERKRKFNFNLKEQGLPLGSKTH
jgi:hypothetical protein